MRAHEDTGSHRRPCVKTRTAKLIVDNVLGLLKREELRIRVSESVEKAFPYLEEPTPRVGSQFAEPAEVLRATVRWVWLAIHADVPSDQIRASVKCVVARSINAVSRVPGSYMRADHDVFLMLAAILSGDSATISAAASASLAADGKPDTYQFLQAWTGLLKFHIIDAHDQEREQLAVLRRCKVLSSYLCPSHALAEAFSSRNWSSLNKCLRRRFSREWHSVARPNVPASSDGTSEAVDVSDRSLNHFWPWAEAAFAKLAHAEGEAVACDDLWLPPRLLEL